MMERPEKIAREEEPFELYARTYVWSDRRSVTKPTATDERGRP